MSNNVACMKKQTRRRAEAPDLLGERLAGRCGRALKREVARAQALTGLDESKLVRVSVEYAVPALLSGRMVYQNGKLVPVAGVSEIPGESSAPVAVGVQAA